MTKQKSKPEDDERRDNPKPKKSDEPPRHAPPPHLRKGARHGSTRRHG